MKKIIVFAFLLISSVTYGQDSERIKDSMALFGPTEIGKPDGTPVSQKIGKEGGTIISSDHKITLIIPRGALSAETLISIQPTTNFAKESMGKAYQLEPSGIQFQLPLQLIFHYTDKEMDGQSPQAMGIASQNEKGIWQHLENVQVDTISKSISGDIRHFSGWTLSWELFIYPMKSYLRTNEQTPIVIQLVNQRDRAPDSENQQALDHFFGPGDSYPKTWYVNDIPGGNTVIGTISSGIYTAPSLVPETNHVEVALEIEGVTFRLGTYTLRRTWSITIVGRRYKVLIENSILASAGTVLGDVTYFDAGTFIVSMEEPEIKITDIDNSADFFSYTGKCTEVKTHEGSGLINVTGIRNWRVTPAQPPLHPFPIVEIIFIPSRVDLSDLQFTCPDRKGGTITISSVFATALLQSMPVLPISITFLAKEGEQILPGSIGRPGDKLYQKISVTQMRD